VAAVLFFLEGTRRFHGKEIRKTYIVLLIAGYLAFQSYFAFLNNNISVRIIFFSLLIGALCGLVALELFQNLPPSSRFVSWYTGGMFALYSIFMFFRGVLVKLLPPLHTFLETNALTTMTLLLGIFFSIAWTFGFVMLNSERLEADLKKVQKKLEKMATTDFLTGIANNRYFLEAGEREVQRAHRYKRPLALLMIDLDHFKKVNDEYGHVVGNKILAAFAAICKKNLRKADIFGRLGGEEFAIILPETDILGGRRYAERLRAIIEKSDIKIGHKTFHITVSIGVTKLLLHQDSFETALKRADDTMYKAKRKGRNQVVIAAR
jgi:diguanylate cyclase (GGDEF)-like protein